MNIGRRQSVVEIMKLHPRHKSMGLNGVAAKCSIWLFFSYRIKNFLMSFEILFLMSRIPIYHH